MYAIRSYYAETSIKDAVREITGGKGADIIYDPVGGDAGGARLSGREKMIAALERLRAQSDPRITSYNVCYTKLLRTDGTVEPRALETLVRLRARWLPESLPGDLAVGTLTEGSGLVDGG